VLAFLAQGAQQEKVRKAVTARTRVAMMSFIFMVLSQVLKWIPVDKDYV
jgi:hypothetical protein